MDDHDHNTIAPRDGPSPAKRSKVALFSNPFNEIESTYLSHHAYDLDTFSNLIELGLSNPATEKAAYLSGWKISALEEYEGFLWTPQRTPYGEIIEKHGQLIALKWEVNFNGRHIEAQKINPPGQESPNHVSYFGDEPWVNYEGELWYDEAWLKAALAYIRGGQMCVALNGINSVRFTDSDGEKRILADIHAPPYSPRAVAHIRFDHWRYSSLESKRETKKAIQILAHLLGGKAREIYDTTIPAPEDNLDGQDLNAYLKRAGEQGLAVIRRNRKLITDYQLGKIKMQNSVAVVEREPPLWIVKKLIPADEHTLVDGATSCGKTFFVMDLGLAIAQEDREKWFHQTIKKHGLVIHITLEGTGLPYRLRAYLKHHNLKPEAIKNYHSIETPVNLREPEVIERLIEAVRDVEQTTEQQAVLIIVDTLNRALAGGNENSSEDIGDYLRNVEEVKAAFPGSAFISVHHLGKDHSKGARGHSSLAANVGAELLVESDEKTGQRTVKIKKMRDGEAGWQLYFQLGVEGLGYDEDKEEITSCYVLPVAVSEGAEEAFAHNVAFHGWWHDKRKSQPFTVNYLRDNLADIKDSGVGMSWRELKTWVETAIKKDWIVLAPDEVGGRGAKYVCIPVEYWGPKYASKG